MNNTPDVSVYMLTYFHEKYISEAIESVLMQKTHYTYELVISDDCSQDGTVDILRKYEAEYPDIIRVNVNETNLGIPANIYKARCMCRGRYITVLSGDDYWIRDDKIEIQTAFMDEHPEYVALYGRVEMRMDGSDTGYEVVPPEKVKLNRVYDLSDYEKSKPLGAHGFFMRNYFLTEEGRAYFAQAQEISSFVDDAVDEVLILRKGPVYIMDIITDAHRVVAASEEKKNYNSRYDRLEKFRHHIELLNAMSNRWGDEIDFSEWYGRYLSMGILGMIASGDVAGYRQVFRSIPTSYIHPVLTGAYARSLKYVIRQVVSRLKRHIYGK